MKKALKAIFFTVILGASMVANSSEFVPENELEETLIQAQMGKIDLASFLEVLKNSKISILLNKETPSSGNWDNSISPLVLNNTNGMPVLAMFTSPNRASQLSQQSNTHKYLLLTDFSWVIKGISPNVGLVINPGWKVGLEMAPQNVAQLRQ